MLGSPACERQRPCRGGVPQEAVPDSYAAWQAGRGFSGVEQYVARADRTEGRRSVEEFRHRHEAHHAEHRECGDRATNYDNYDAVVVLRLANSLFKKYLE